MSKQKSDEELERLAKQELLREAQRGAERSKTMGTQGWLKPKLPSMNKRFLHRTLASATLDVDRQKRLKAARDRSTPVALEPSSSGSRNPDAAEVESTEGDASSSNQESPRKRKKKESNAMDAKNRKR